eukprot:TRINITY_DN7430_c0_g1_i2.p1 TRINITY_DN7430_c0_g1~~TRINITY_DN7430_c0_g1_i2.p1  ORF type:complete len:262 (+),score=44.30 TRINITY_DN7430_c0_g1_i2:43-828(+)
MPPQQKGRKASTDQNALEHKITKLITPDCAVREGQSLLKAQYDQNYFHLDSKHGLSLQLKRTHSGVSQNIQMCQFPIFPHPTTNETASTIISIITKDPCGLPKDLEMTIDVVDVSGATVPNGVKISKNGCADSIKVSVGIDGVCSAKLGMAATSSSHYDCKTKEFSSMCHRGYLYFRIGLYIPSKEYKTSVWTPPMWSISRMPQGRSAYDSSFVMIPKRDGVIVCDAQTLTKHAYKGREVQGQRQFRKSIKTSGSGLEKYC